MVAQVTTRKVRLSVTVSPELKAATEEIARETNTTSSGVISKCLEELVRSRKDALMIKYYEVMAQEDEEFAKKSISVIQEIASSWSD